MSDTQSLRPKLGRAGNILRRATLSGLDDYERRFSEASEWYESLLKDVIIDHHDRVEAFKTAKKFFGKDEINFVAIDGTEYSRLLFDMVIFYAGAFSSEGAIDFSEENTIITYKDRFMEKGKDLSTCVPIYINKIPQIDQSFHEPKEPHVNVMKPLTDETILDNTNIANSIMTFSEFYLAYLYAAEGNVNIILLDRSLSNTYSSLIYDTSIRGLWKDNCSIINFEIDGIPTDINDLTICRHQVVNSALNLPPHRGDYLRYAIISELSKNEGFIDFNLICENLGANSSDRISKRIRRYLSRWVDEGVLQESNGGYSLVQRYRSSWTRVQRLVSIVGDQLFQGEDPSSITQESGKEWITTLDFAFITLFSLYMLIEKCWKNNILLIGITKDTAAHEFKNHVMPICLNNAIWSSKKLGQRQLNDIPNTDRMFLQSLSMKKHEAINVPWALIEYDSCFITAVPDFKNRIGYLSGAIRNRITPSKMFLRSFVQLQRGIHDTILRSNVLAIDRLVYPQFDNFKDVIFDFKHEFGGDETIQLILYKNNKVPNPLQNLIISILESMSAPSIAEAFGHNKGLYIADKVAKWHNEQFRKIVDSTASLIMCNKGLRDYVFYMNSFREKRQGFETTRKA